MKKKVVIKQQQAQILEPDSPEYRIAVMQLHKLEKISAERLFSPDEAQLYNILCKSINLAKGQPTTISATYTKEKDMDDADLIDIAKGEVTDITQLVTENGKSDKAN